MARPRSPGLRPAVARAMTSPTGVVAAVVGGGAGFLIEPLLAVPFALLGWGVRVAAALPRSRRSAAATIDPFTLKEPWRRWVQGALSARARFERTVATLAPGPLRDRLTEIGGRLDAAVQECWLVARRGEQLVDARREIDATGARRRLTTLQGELSAGPGGGPPDAAEPTAQTVRSLEARVASAERLDHVIETAQRRLSLLDARIAEAVAHTIELSVSADAPGALGTLGSDIDEVVLEMEALRLALEETGAGSGPGPAGAPGPA